MPVPKARLALVVVLALALPILPFAIVGELPGERWLSHTDADALLFGLTGGGLLAADLLLPVPSSIVGTLLGARLGFLAGLAWAFAGLMLGALIGYGVGRLLGRGLGTAPTTARPDRPELPQELPPGLPAAPTLLALLLSRPVPVLAEAAVVTAGATALPIGPVLAACAAGNLAYAAALAGSGAALLPAGFAGPGLAIPLAIPAIGWLAWRWRDRRRA